MTIKPHFSSETRDIATDAVQPAAGERSRRRWGTSYILRIFAMAAIYFLAGELSNKFASVQANASPVWLPSGLAIGAVMIFGYRYVPAILIGEIFVDLMVFDFGSEGDISLWKATLVSIGIGIGNVFEATAAVWLLKKFANGIHCLAKLKTVIRFAFFGALLSPLLSAGMGVLSLYLGGRIDPGLSGIVFLTWMTGNAVGILTVTPLMFCLWGSSSFKPSVRQSGEVAAMLTLLVLMSLAVMGVGVPDVLRGLPHVYMVVPLIFWAALRLGRPVTILSVLLLSAITIIGTVRGEGILFPGPSPNHSLIYLQIFIGVVSVIGLSVSALSSELRSIHEGLEQAVEDRTVRLEHLHREKDDFLSVAVHELQSPLAGLRNLFRWLRSNPSALWNSKADELAETMESAADAMQLQVQKLLRSQQMYARSDRSETAFENLGDLFEACMRTQSFTAMEKEISVDLKLPDEPVKAMTERDSVKHILGNLISNAIKFTPHGGNIYLRLSRFGETARYEIQDTGPGVPRGQIDHIFHRFQRGTAEPTAGEQSTGLGLYIVGKIVEQLGGEIRCRSIMGEGASFIFDLPINPQS